MMDLSGELLLYANILTKFTLSTNIQMIPSDIILEKRSAYL